MSTLTNKVKTTLCKTAVAAGSTDITDALAVDMAGFESVRFIFALGTITSGAATSVAASMLGTSSPTPGTDDVAGSKITVIDTADDTLFILDIVKPALRYVRPFVKRATQNAVLNCIIAEQYEHAGKMPVAAAATVTAQTLLISPINGTA